MIIFMKKLKNLVRFLLMFILALQLSNSLDSLKTSYSLIEYVDLTNNIKNINTLSIVHHDIDEKPLLNSEFSRYNPIYESYYLEKSQEKSKNLYITNAVSESALNKTTHLPESFKYCSVNEVALKKYLSTRLSFLINEPYFSSIINVSREFNINPLLLFAIIGQEQSFVPNTEVSALKIANNPYNVFYSWQNYNTDIVDSSEIACRTIINLSKDKPDSVDPLIWINRKYSSDQNWHYGVRTLYNEILAYINS